MNIEHLFSVFGYFLMFAWSCGWFGWLYQDFLVAQVFYPLLPIKTSLEFLGFLIPNQNTKKIPNASKSYVTHHPTSFQKNIKKNRSVLRKAMVRSEFHLEGLRKRPPPGREPLRLAARLARCRVERVGRLEMGWAAWPIGRRSRSWFVYVSWSCLIDVCNFLSCLL